MLSTLMTNGPLKRSAMINFKSHIKFLYYYSGSYSVDVIYLDSEQLDLRGGVR